MKQCISTALKTAVQCHILSACQIATAPCAVGGTAATDKGPALASELQQEN